jgi:HlyD family secretion protein
MTLADMSRLLFRGTVNEIDVGRLREGMAAQIKVGPLPGTILAGTLAEIALKARERDNATVFDVVIDIEVPPETVLRSGYSAVAEIEIERRDDIVVLPERAVEYRKGAAFVRVARGGGEPELREISAGLSDGLTVEVVRGLAAGEEVLE